MTDENKTEEIEETFEEPVTKIPITASLEPCKSKFFANDMKAFEAEISCGKFRLFETTYKYNEDYDGSPEFVVKNFVNGMIKQLEDKRKYLFVAFKCTKNNGKHVLTASWITNVTIPMEELVNDKYSDFEWTELDINNNCNISNVCTQFSRDQPGNVLVMAYLH